MRLKFLDRAGSLTLIAVMAASLAGCGGNPTTPPPTTPSTTPAPTLTLSLVDATTGIAVTSISSGSPAKANATLKDTNGVAVSNTVVSFTTDNTLVAMSPSNGTALTDATGVATIQLAPISISSEGATTISASAQIENTAVTNSTGYSIGATTLSISAPSFGASPLSAYGTTSVSVTVSSGGTPVSTPQTVNFTSSCAGSGKASLSTGISTVAGVATASYRDIGCAGTDNITATVSGGLASSSASLVVTAPTAGSIQFVSATPTLINLKGTGGTEASQVVFKVLDEGGSPISGKTVSFTIDDNAIAGGVTLTPSPSTAISDSSGFVQTTVNAGTVSTPARVSATTTGTGGVTLNSTSSLLTITTGIADQDSFSLSASTFNIEGFAYDGVTTILTARLADHFNNPVPDGTAVNFTTEGGSIVGSCATTGGVCSSTLSSQNPRPSNGRVTVLAYAVGEESFTDLNGNGWADLAPTNEMIDANAASTDLAEAFVDYNENGTRDAATEPFIDFNNDGAFNAADGKYSGVLCDNVNAGRSSAGTCASGKSTHVRASHQIIFSSSHPGAILIGGINLSTSVTVALDPCVPGAPPPGPGRTGLPSNITVTVYDENGNAMPQGTSVAIGTDNGTIVGDSSYVVENTTACRFGVAGCPLPATPSSTTLGDYVFILKSDAIYDPAAGTCANTSASGTLTVTVTTPKGNITRATASVTD